MKKVYLETFGCQMNVSDSERAATSLENNGYEIVSDENLADIVLLNTCSVREKAEHKLYSKVGEIRSRQNLKKPLIGILGCVAQLEGETLFQKNKSIDFVLGTRAVGRVSQAIENVLASRERVTDLGEREESYDWSVNETRRSSPFVAFVPIIEGCNKFCTYCIVPFSRGRERSLTADEIVRQIYKLREKGIREVHLIGQNVNSYRPQSESGLSDVKGATAFSRLLRAVAKTGMERIKFTTSFPRDFHPDIVDVINENENLCKWVHLPVQSGSNNILKVMRRGHTIESYLKKIDKIKSSPERIALTTDFIVGFPNESEKDFLETLKLVEYCQFDSSYVFKYSPRAGTPASQMVDNISEKEKTARFLEFEQVQKVFQQKALHYYVDKIIDVLAEKVSSKADGELSGHTGCQKVVNFKGSEELLGKILKIKILKAKSNTLYGELA